MKTLTRSGLVLLVPGAALLVHCGSSSSSAGSGGSTSSTLSGAGSTVSSMSGSASTTSAGGAGGSSASSSNGAPASSGAGGASSSSTSSSSTSSSSGAGGGMFYSTMFPLTENPISENGHWLNGGAQGLDWHDVSTTPGLAIGHQTGASYTDGTALLTGSWGPDQTAEAVVHAVNPKDSCYQEVELRLRSAVSAKSCTGYEVSFKASPTSGAYLILVRWNGALGDFSYLNQYNGAQYGVTEGDVVKATITGNVIKAYKNGVEMGSATDDVFKAGSPGMGFNLETADASCIATNGDYGFTQFTATSN